ncbi:hypothetical protein [Ekhidna sp.]
MKTLYTTIILVFSLNAFAQQSIENWSHPFQTLFVDSSNVIGTQRDLKQFDFVSKYDLLQIHGRLTLIHFSGKIIELADTTIKINDLAKAYQKDEYFERPVISDPELFVNQSINKKLRANKYPVIRICGIPELQIVYPIYSEGELYANDMKDYVHLIWESSEDFESYIVRFQNIFDENILTIKTDSNSLILPREKLPKDELAIVEISTEDKKYSTGYFAIRFKKFQQKTAKRKLIEALTEQWLGNKSVSDIYFKEAINLSNNDPRFLKLYKEFQMLNPTSISTVEE